MKIAVFGGSFDPPHVAHVMAVHYVLSVGFADRVLVMPVYHHALGKRLTPFELRAEMCRKAFPGDSRIEVSLLESTLPAPNYTLHTVQALEARLPKDELRLIVGADILAETKNWHSFDEVTKIAPLIVLGRAGINDANAPPAVLPPVSSSEARSWWGESASDEDKQQRQRLIPAAVREVIEREGLYRVPK